MALMRLQQAVAGKVVVVTGASDGIGEHLAHRLAAAGARVLLVARSADKLKAVGDELRAAGGEAHEYVADLSKEEECQRAVTEILADHGSVDIFVSNAGRSIRRSAKYQGQERFHDFQRLMSLNFFGALRMILGVLPSMLEKRCGHIVHVSSFGVPTRQPRFAGYAASKSALDAALQSVAGEVASQGVHTSSVLMPLVETKMVQSKGHSYDHLALLSLDGACELIEHAIITKESEVIDGPSRFLSLLYFFRPSLIVGLNSLVYGMETEQAPDGLAREKSREEMARRQRRNAKSRFTPLKALGCLLAFFQRLEMLLRRLGLISITRDPIIILILALVMLVECVVVAGMAAAGLVRGGLRAIGGGGISRAVASEDADDGDCIDAQGARRLPHLLGGHRSPVTARPALSSAACSEKLLVAMPSHARPKPGLASDLSDRAATDDAAVHCASRE